MKKLRILVLFIVIPICVIAQQKTEYNRKGDAAMKRLDYSDARMWYEEGVAQCDPYSIDQLTTIWLANERMRPSMRSLMNKCLNCLNLRATEGDTTAVSSLIVYYTEGIIDGPKSNELASYWEDRLETLRKPAKPIVSSPVEKQKESRPKEPMKFFVGYAYSLEAPYGITVGGVKERLGWYARFRTNLSFAGYTSESRGNGEISLPGNPIFNFTNQKKVNTYAGVAGLVVKCTPWLYTSIGLGYGSRELLCEYTITDASDYKKQTSHWSKNVDYSYNGLAADLDFMVKLGPVFISAGCNTLNFKYIDLNAGLGVFF